MNRLTLLLLSCACTGSAMFMRPEWVPVDRLVRNTSRYVEAHPTDASAHYALGRLHYLAFTLKMDLVPAFPQRDGEAARPVPDHLVGLPVAGAREQRAIDLAREEFGAKADDPAQRQAFFQAVSRHREKLEAANWAPPPATPQSLVSHATQAVSSFRKAMELNPKDALFPLGLGSLLVQFADWSEDKRQARLPENLRGDLRLEARRQFFAAWKLAYTSESKAKFLPLGGLTEFASFEAGHAFLRLAGVDPKSLSAEEKEAIPKIEAGVAALEKLPMGAITPLVVSLKPRTHLSTMLPTGLSVEFSMSGIGKRERWQWISPELGLLVWDPLDRREITSGHQLFGNFSFQSIWRNGFDALRALDDNSDGQVADSELPGLSLWFDRNSDGRSSRAEVMALEQLGIRSIACAATESEGPHPVNWSGVQFLDGRSVPVWDWLAQPMRDEHVE